MAQRKSERQMRREGRYPLKCMYCGKYLSYNALDNGEAGSEFTPDTAFSTESVDFYHTACKANGEVQA